MGPWCRRRPGIRRPLKEDAAGWLLTHHQPCGWSPALVKGGYRGRGLFALVPYYIASKISSEKHNMVSIITMDAKRQPESIPALCVGCYTLVASGPLVFAQGRLPVCLYPPFALVTIPSWLPDPWFCTRMLARVRISALCVGCYTLVVCGSLFFCTRALARVFTIRPFQGRGTVAPAQWWWVRRRFSFGAVSFFLFYRSLKFWTVIFCSFTSWRIS